MSTGTKSGSQVFVLVAVPSDELISLERDVEETCLTNLRCLTFRLGHEIHGFGGGGNWCSVEQRDH